MQLQKQGKVLVVLSGGQDSTTCLNIAKVDYEEVHAVTFDYGQKHSIEIRSALNVGRLADVASHQVIKVGNILQGRSPLTNPNEELEQYSSFQQMDKTIGDRVELTFVPMRNALFLTLAANIAICMDIYDVMTGVCQADNANYPDCRGEFITAQELSTRLALGLDLQSKYTNFRILTPLMFMTKAQSIFSARMIPGAYEMLAFTHTAYDGQYPPIGHDHATTLRAHGFEEAEVPDPLVIRAWSEGRMELPNTDNYSNRDFNHDLVRVINFMKRKLT